jgi:maltose alpha-D-glucosyltransferase/alpha-amylase
MPWPEVTDQRQDPGSLLTWMESLVQARKEMPEFGTGSYEVLDTGNERVFALRCETRGVAVVAVHNLSDERQQARLELREDEPRDVVAVFGQGEPEKKFDLHDFELEPYGYRWLRLGTPG